MKKGRLPFDLSRVDDPDNTLETVLDADTSTATYDLLDTSRPPEEPPLTANDSFAKLPDDNMNSELTRSSFHTDNSKIQPTLQPNGWNPPPSTPYKNYTRGRRPRKPQGFTRQFEIEIVQNHFFLVVVRRRYTIIEARFREDSLAFRS